MKKLLPFLTLTLCVSAGLAEPPPPDVNSPESVAEALVTKELLAPLEKVEKKRSRFSRAAPVPRERRVRLLGRATESDARGRSFVRFAIDERSPMLVENGWHSSIEGCAYPKERKVYVLRGEAYFPARSVLGADAREQPGVCQAAHVSASEAPADAERS